MTAILETVPDRARELSSQRLRAVAEADAPSAIYGFEAVSDTPKLCSLKAAVLEVGMAILLACGGLALVAGQWGASQVDLAAAHHEARAAVAVADAGELLAAMPVERLGRLAGTSLAIGDRDTFRLEFVDARPVEAVRGGLEIEARLVDAGDATEHASFVTRRAAR